MIKINPKTKDEKKEKHFLVAPTKEGIIVFKKDGTEIVQRIALTHEALETIFTFYLENRPKYLKEKYGNK